MKRLICLICALLVMIETFSVEAADKTIAVMPLENASKFDKVNVAEIMTEEIMIALQNSGRYSVLERTQMNAILQEQGFQNITADQSTIVQIGKIIGANYSLVGKVTMVQLKHGNLASKVMTSIVFKKKGVRGKINADIRVIDNETGELVFAKSFSGEEKGDTSEEALHNACREAAEEFLNELTADLSGRIIDVSKNVIYIDKGSKNGIREKDVFLIFRELSPIEIDGRVVDMKKIQIGKAKVVEVYNEYSICKILSDKRKYPIQKGDLVMKE